MKKACILFFLSFLFIHSSALSWHSIDSLLSALDQTDLLDSNKVKVLNNLAWEYALEDLEKADFYCQKSLQLADSIDYPMGYYDAIAIKATIAFNGGDIDKGVQLFEKALKLAEAMSFEAGVMKISSNLAMIAFQRGDYKEADSVYKKVLLFARTVKDTAQMIVCLINASASHQHQGKYVQALDELVAAMNLSEATSNVHRVQILSNMGIIFGDLGDHEKGIHYFRQVLDLKTPIPKRLLPILYGNLGNYYNTLELRDSAEWYFDLALKDTVQSIHRWYAYKGMAELNLHKNDWRKAEAWIQKAYDFAKKKSLHDEYFTTLVLLGKVKAQQNNYSEAIDLFLEAEKGLEEINDLPVLHNARLELLFAYANRDFPGILEPLIAYYKIKDTLLNKKVRDEAQAIEINYQTRQIADSIRILQLRDAATSQKMELQKRTNTYLLSIALLLLALTTLIGFLFYQKKKQAALFLGQHEQINFLHAELTHRVKNNLQIITSLLRMQERRLEHPKAKEAIRESQSRVKAIGLIHNRLEIQKSDLINIRSYMQDMCRDLQRGFGAGFPESVIQLEVEEMELRSGTAVYLGLVVNELVTNAFKYAFDNQRNPLIEIRLHQENTTSLLLKVADNGKGLPKQLSMNTQSMGITLIRTMTEQLKGVLEIENKNGAHFALRVPYHKIAS